MKDIEIAPRITTNRENVRNRAISSWNIERKYSTNTDTENPSSIAIDLRECGGDKRDHESEGKG